jgi:hypothetical protein
MQPHAHEQLAALIDAQAKELGKGLDQDQAGGGGALADPASGGGGGGALAAPAAGGGGGAAEGSGGEPLSLPFLDTPESIAFREQLRAYILGIMNHDKPLALPVGKENPIPDPKNTKATEKATILYRAMIEHLCINLLPKLSDSANRLKNVGILLNTFVCFLQFSDQDYKARIDGKFLNGGAKDASLNDLIMILEMPGEYLRLSSALKQAFSSSLEPAGAASVEEEGKEAFSSSLESAGAASAEEVEDEDDMVEQIIMHIQEQLVKELRTTHPKVFKMLDSLLGEDSKTAEADEYSRTAEADAQLSKWYCKYKELSKKTIETMEDPSKKDEMKGIRLQWAVANTELKSITRDLTTEQTSIGQQTINLINKLPIEVMNQNGLVAIMAEHSDFSSPFNFNIRPNPPTPDELITWINQFIPKAKEAGAQANHARLIDTLMNILDHPYGFFDKYQHRSLRQLVGVKNTLEKVIKTLEGAETAVEDAPEARSLGSGGGGA